MHLKKKEIVVVLFVFLVAFVFYGVIGNYSKQLSVYPDELYYLDTARNLFYGNGFLIHNIASGWQKILYSLFLVPAFFFSSPVVAINWINSLIMTSSVFPGYLLAKKIVKSSRWAVLVSVLIVTLPNMINTQYFMSEVLLYPLSLWLVYFVYLFFATDTMKRKTAYSLILGVLFYLSYFNKEVTLYFLLAFFIVVFLDVVIFRLEKKRELLYLLPIGSIFVLIHIALQFFVFTEPGVKYTAESISSLFSFEKIISFIYYTIYDFGFALLGFGVIPIIVAIAGMRKKDKAKFEFTIFLLLSFVIACAVISYMISLPYDMGQRSARIHLRYIDPMIIPFVIIMVQTVRDQSYSMNNKMKKTLLIAFLAFGALFLVICYKVGVGCHADQSTLKWYQLVTGKVEALAANFPNCTFLEEIVMGVFRLICIVVFGGFIWLIINKRKVGLCIVVTFFIAMNTFNFGIACRDAKNNYAISDKTDKQLKVADRYLNQLSGNILMISGTGLGPDNRLIDANISRLIYVTGTEHIYELNYLQDGVWDLASEKVKCDYPYEFYDIDAVDYILVPDGINVYQHSVEKMDDFPLDGFRLYKNKDSSKIYLKSYFPTKVGQKKVFTVDSSGFFSQCKNNGECVSTQENQAVLYGPYRTLYAGIYKFELNYAYEGDVPDGQSIGWVEIGGEGNDKMALFEIYAPGPQLVMENVQALQSLENAEIRVFSRTSGLKIESISVQRVG